MPEVVWVIQVSRHYSDFRWIAVDEEAVTPDNWRYTDDLPAARRMNDLDCLTVLKAMYRDWDGDWLREVRMIRPEVVEQEWADRAVSSLALLGRATL